MSPSNCLPVPRESITWTRAQFTSSLHRYLTFARLETTPRTAESRMVHHTSVVRLRASSTNPLAVSECKRGRHNVRLPKKQQSTNPSPCMTHPCVVVCNRGSRSRGWDRVSECDSSAYTPSATHLSQHAGRTGIFGRKPGICMHACRARTANLQAFRAEVSSPLTSL